MISRCCQSAVSTVLPILTTVLIRLLVLECDIAQRNVFFAFINNIICKCFEFSLGKCSSVDDADDEMVF